MEIDDQQGISYQLISVLDCRNKLKYTQSEMAKALGVSRMTIYRWENERTKPRSDHCQKINELYYGYSSPDSVASAKLVKRIFTEKRGQYKKGTRKKQEHRNNRKSDFKCPREAVRMTFNTLDLMNKPVEKTIEMLEKIITGDKLFK